MWVAVVSELHSHAHIMDRWSDGHAFFITYVYIYPQTQHINRLIMCACGAIAACYVIFFTADMQQLQVPACMIAI